MERESEGERGGRTERGREGVGEGGRDRRGTIKGGKRGYLGTGKSKLYQNLTQDESKCGQH